MRSMILPDDSSLELSSSDPSVVSGEDCVGWVGRLSRGLLVNWEGSLIFFGTADTSTLAASWAGSLNLPFTRGLGVVGGKGATALVNCTGSLNIGRRGISIDLATAC